MNEKTIFLKDSTTVYYKQALCGIVKELFKIFIYIENHGQKQNSEPQPDSPSYLNGES